MLLVASLWHEERGIFQLPFHLERYDNLFGCGVETLPNLWNGSNQQFLVALFQLALIFVGEALVDSSVFHVNIVDKSVLVGIIVDDGKDIDVCNGMAYHLAFSLKFVEQQVLPFIFLSYLKLEDFGVFHHHIIEIFAHFTCVSLQNLAGLTHVFLVLLVALLVDARSTAIMDMII